MVKLKIVKEWFTNGDKDIKNAEFLFKGGRDLETVAFHIQQAAEKYLKGFLIAQGKELAMIHDLVTLLRNAIEADPEFIQFKDAVKQITNFYFESRYPMGYKVEYARGEIKTAIAQVNGLIALIEHKVGKRRPRKRKTRS
jgi:HEPN domain-containing protein